MLSSQQESTSRAINLPEGREHSPHTPPGPPPPTGDDIRQFIESKLAEYKSLMVREPIPTAHQEEQPDSSPSLTPPQADTPTLQPSTSTAEVVRPAVNVNVNDW